MARVVVRSDDRADRRRLHLRQSTRPARTPSSSIPARPARSRSPMSRRRRCDPQRQGVRDAARAAGGRGPARRWKSPSAAGVDHRVQSRAGRSPFPDAIYPLCDYIVPNETEAAALTGFAVATVDDARARGRRLAGEGRRQRADHAGRDGRAAPQPRAVRRWSRLSRRARWSTRPAPAMPSSAASRRRWRAGSIRSRPRASAAPSPASPSRAAGTAPSMPRLAEIEALLARR